MKRMSRLEQELSGSLGVFWKEKAEREINRIWKQASDGEILLTGEKAAYWKTNGRFLPEECIEKLMHTPYRTVISREATADARAKQEAEAIEAYRRAQEKARDEQTAEMQAVFGKGTTILNVLTGERYEI